jgi:hypothetical protein
MLHLCGHIPITRLSEAGFGAQMYQGDRLTTGASRLASRCAASKGRLSCNRGLFGPVGLGGALGTSCNSSGSPAGAIIARHATLLHHFSIIVIWRLISEPNTTLSKRLDEPGQESVFISGAR